MIKIAYIIPNIEIGGTEKHLLSVIKKIDKNLFSLFLITTAGGGSLYDDFKKIVPVFILGGSPYEARKKPPTNPFIHINTVLKIVDILKREKPHIVHCYLPAANSLGPIAAKIARIPFIIVGKRSLAKYKKGHPIISKLESLGNLFSNFILANSLAVKEEVEKTESFSKEKIEVIYNGVEIPDVWEEEKRKEFRKKENFNENVIYAICVSNFFAYKGHEELVKAANILKNEIPQLQYLFIGRDAGNIEYIKKLVKKLNLENKIHFLGEKKNILDFLRTSDIFIHPSRQEGFSNSILEAMACGLPVIACEVGGNKEAITNSVTGKLVPKENPIALAQSISELIKNPSRMKEMGKNGRKKAIDFFSMEKIVLNIENFYKRIYSSKYGNI